MKQSMPKIRNVVMKTPAQRAAYNAGKYKAVPSGSQGVRAMYEAGGYGKRAQQAFINANGYSAEYVLGKSLTTIQNRILHEVRNSPMTGSIVDTIVRTTLGTGLKPKVKNEALRAAFLEWAPNANADGRLSFDATLSLALREIVVKGEVFGRHRDRYMEDVKAGKVSVPYQAQLIPSEQLPLTRPGELLKTDPDSDFRSGIYFDPIGQREGYLFLKKHPRSGVVITSEDYTKVLASEVMHVFQDRETGQLRGEPWLVRSIVRLHELDEYMDAELLKKKSAAKINAFWKAPEPKYGQSIIEGEDGEAEIEEDFSFIPRDIDPGAQFITPPGWEVVLHQAHEVGGDFAVFVRNVVMEACAAAYAPYELVTGDYSQTQERMVRFHYKAIYEQVVNARREMLISQFARPIFARFVKAAVESGRWTPPEGETWQEHAYPEWHGQPMPYPNPVQEANAKRILIDAGLESRSGAMRDLGKDPDQVAQEMREDKERFAGLPVGEGLKDATDA